MAAMVVGYALAKPTHQDHANEGYDVLLTPDQFSKLKPGSLHGMAGKCVPNEQNKFVNGNLDTIEDCLKWCVNENVVEQRDIGACEYNENDGKPVCTAFKASAFKDNNVTSSENDVGYTCYSLFPDSERRSARGLQVSNFWPNNELIYDIVDASDPNSWEKNGFSQSSAIKYINRAIVEYHTKTNIRFVKRTTEANYVSIGYFNGGCSSNVGKVNGAQQMTLGWCRSSLRSIIHEFGHALGMWHEHQRADRDTYLNVPSGANHNFNIQNTDSRGIEYDFGSIMHYPLRTRRSDGTGTIVMTLTTEGKALRSEQKNPTIGQRAGLSQLDIDGLATVYPQLTTGLRFAAKGNGYSNYYNGAYAEIIPTSWWSIYRDRFAVRCCSDTPIQGWKQTCNSIYTASAAWWAGCQSKKTFSEAEDFCAYVGGRLCTKTEVLGGCVKGTGCNFDRKLIWTSSIENAPGCASWCVRAANSHPWKEKCAWGSCNKCKSCNSLE